MMIRSSRQQKPARPAVDHATSRRSVTAWVLWDVGSSSFDSIMMTFIFTVYLTSGYFGTPEQTSSALSLGLTVAGFLIAFSPRSRANATTGRAAASSGWV